MKSNMAVALESDPPAQARIDAPPSRRLKILVISNFYPPYHQGGYELGCMEIMGELTRRGHSFQVLTSRRDPKLKETNGNICRWLLRDVEWLGVRSLSHRLTFLLWERECRRAALKLLREFEPDLVYFWNMRELCASMIHVVQQQGTVPFCFYVSDDWLAKSRIDDQWLAWQAKPPKRSLSESIWGVIEKLLGTPRSGASLQAEHLQEVQFTSRYMKDVTSKAGIALKNTSIIHWGVNPERFAYRAERRGSIKKLLFTGLLSPNKGALTAIRALGHLAKTENVHDLQLTLAGRASHPEYVKLLQEAVEEFGLRNRVHFLGSLDREQLPEIYRSHDVYLFTSIWEEPFSIALLEALSSGLAVVATSTGGTPEVLEHEKNALVFEKDDAEDCARQLLRLMRDPELGERIRQNGRETVEAQFRFDQMVAKIESSLMQVAAAQP